MNGIFKSYTEIRKPKIDSIVEKVNEEFLKCQKITYDQTKVTIDNNGVLYHGTLEEKYFIDKTNEFRRRLRNGETLDDILVEALALVKEAIRRKTSMTPYDTQLEACISMIGEKIDDNYRRRVIAEMKTGEGKTLVQILVSYLNALEATKDENRNNWTSVHIMTSNDALAKRDQKLSQEVFKLLGLTSGFVPSRSASKTNDLSQRLINKHKKQMAYSCDIVYATTTTIAFDYLEDNTIYDKKDRNITRGFGYAIVDEADDILIDQAINPLRLSQTPRIDGSEYDKLIIQRNKSMRELYKWATEFLYGKIRKHPMTSKIYDRYFDNKNEILGKEDEYQKEYVYVRDTKEVFLSEKIAKEIGADLKDTPYDNAIYSARYYALINCIKAKEAYRNNVEYKVEVKDGKAKIVLIDQNIGRKKYSNKYTGGMQEAIEAKEEYLECDSSDAKKRYHVEFSNNSVVKATCTYPDFISIYEHGVCGMTGTSDEEEFRDLYGFETYRVSSRKRNIRIDESEELYATLNEKYNAIINEIKKCVSKGQPVLIGTTSVHESKVISSLLEKSFIRHKVLNADNEEEENEIIQGAGMMGSVTVSTNMAGRGTDIKLGEGVREVGGLYVIGTSYNKSKRVDLQLMGRSARQGDPGKTKYFVSLEDEIVREYFKNNELKSIIKYYSNTNKPIKNPNIIRLAKKAQSSRESKDKKIRSDNERFNKSFMAHRKIIYDNRNEVLNFDLKDFMTMIKRIITKYTDILIKNNSKEEITNLIGHLISVKNVYNSDTSKMRLNIINALYDRFKSNFDVKNVKNNDILNYVNNIRYKFLNLIDMYWLGHIEYLEDLRMSLSNPFTDNPFKAFELESTKVFTDKLIPSLYNELITYALNPNLKFGEYVINSVNEEEEEKTL